MNVGDRDLNAYTAQLREAFDSVFAEPPPALATAPDPYLAISVDASRLAVPLRDVAALEVDKPLASVFAETPAALGVVAARGTILAVYDLHACLGHTPCRTGRWLIQVKGAPLAFAFDRYDGHVHLAVANASDTIAKQESIAYRIVDLAAIVNDIRRRIQPLSATQRASGRSQS